MRPVHAEPRYLVGESARHVVRFLQARPILGSLMVLAVFGGVLGVLHWRFRRGAAFDMIVFACFVTVTIIWLGSVLYTYLHYPGFHFGG